MKTTKTLIVIIVTFIFAITGCSRKNDSFISRNYHALTARDNILFNGYNALEKGQQTLHDSYQDNYWEILPIERMEVKDEIKLDAPSKNENFNRAEEKAVKAVQKHGMNIDGKERNPQMDEAYLLLGKARYFDQRFVPALESFNYILYKHPASSKINQAKVWREKTNIRLDNNDIAIKNLKRLLEQEELEKQDLADATAMLAQAYINTKALDSALTQIKIAASTTKKRYEQGRYNFIKGQLYNLLQDKDSANLAFDEVIDLNRKIPRKYLINAHLEKAKNFNFKTGDKLAYIEHLTKLEEDRENRPFLDKIYYQIGDYYLKNNNDSLATTYFNKSLRKNSPDKILVAKNYETLGDMSFDKNHYKLAGAYYDSTMTSMVENSKPYRVLKRKRENLEDVIKYETIAETNDSILTVIAMPKDKQISYFQEHVNKLKAEAEAIAEQEAIALQKQGLVTNNAGNTNNNFIKPAGSKASTSTFYFYNDQTVAYGKNQFLSIWGQRELKDNWRWSSNKIIKANTTSSDSIQQVATQEDLFDVFYYLKQVPTDETEIATLKKDRNYAYYQLGLIYKEKFKEYELSKNKFQALLKNNPEERLILPSKYHLYKIYEALGETSEATIAKNEIIANYPDSRYASIIKNPEIALEKDENSPESIYEATYKLYENQNYTEAIAKTNKYITLFEGEPIVPKLELLKAYATARLYGFQDYKKALNQVAVNYANTPEGIQAQNLIDKSLSTIEASEFKDETSITNCKTVFSFKNASKTELNNFKEIIDKAIEKKKYFHMSTSIDVYNPETTFVVVHGIQSINIAKAFSNIFDPIEKSRISKPYIGISSENYKIIQIHKNLDEYKTNQKL